MGRWERLLAAVMAAAVIAFTSAAYAALWHLWRHPPRPDIEPFSDGFLWRGGRYAAEVTWRGGVLEHLTVWRRE